MSDWLEGRAAGLGFGRPGSRFGAESVGGPTGQRPTDSTLERGPGPSAAARPDRSGSTESAAETANRCRPEAGREPNRVTSSVGPNEEGHRPNEEGHRPNEEGDRPNQEGDRPNEEGHRPNEEGDLKGGPGISEELATRAVADEAFAEAQGVPPAPEGLDPDSADAAGVAAKERDEYREALVRLQADFENYKKRIAKQQEELRDRAAEALIEKLLPVLDTADLALAHGGGEDVKQIFSALFSALEREGLERIDELGATFDPTLHDAVAHEPGDGHTQEVAEVMRAGYRWRGRVLRPAMVKVRG